MRMVNMTLVTLFTGREIFDLCKDSDSLLLQRLGPPSEYEDLIEDIVGLHGYIKDVNALKIFR
jgi:hypothetical protein